MSKKRKQEDITKEITLKKGSKAMEELTKLAQVHTLPNLNSSSVTNSEFYKKIMQEDVARVYLNASGSYQLPELLTAHGSYSIVPPPAMILLAKIAAVSPNLYKLNISRNKLSEYGLAVARELESSRLSEIDMSHNELGSNGLHVVKALLKIPTLRTLQMVDSSLDGHDTDDDEYTAAEAEAYSYKAQIKDRIKSHNDEIRPKITALIDDSLTPTLPTELTMLIGQYDESIELCI